MTTQEFATQFETREASLLTSVRFVASIPAEGANACPPERELANLISADLERAGFQNKRSTDRGRRGWGFCTKSDQLEIISVIDSIDNLEESAARKWLISTGCELSLLQRILGGQAVLDQRDEILRTDCAALHQILLSDPRFSQVVWYRDPHIFAA